jgi:hypothetical protein
VSGFAPAEGEGVALRYKVVETSSVTDEELERIVNEWAAQGWSFDGFHFAMRESSKRPAMAFVTFTREGDAEP